MDMKGKIIELLLNENLREKVVNIITKSYNTACGFFYDPDHYPNEDRGTRWFNAFDNAQSWRSIEDIEKAFDKYVFAKIEKPYIILPEELKSILHSLVFPGDCGDPTFEAVDFKSVYLIFVFNVADHLSNQATEYFHFCNTSEEQEFAKGFLLVLCPS